MCQCDWLRRGVHFSTRWEQTNKKKENDHYAVKLTLWRWRKKKQKQHLSRKWWIEESVIAIGECACVCVRAINRSFCIVAYFENWHSTPHQMWNRCTKNWSSIFCIFISAHFSDNFTFYSDNYEHDRGFQKMSVFDFFTIEMESNQSKWMLGKFSFRWDWI